MRRLILSLALLLGLAAPAQAVAIIAGTDTGGALGHNSNTGSTTIAITTTVLVPAGSLIVAMPVAGASLTWNSCTDSASNTYTAASANTLSGTHAVRMFYSVTANSLSNGGTITCTANSASSVKTFVAAAFSGITATPIDSAGISNGPAAAGVTGTGTTFTVGPTGTLTYPGGSNGEVLLGVVQSGTTGPPTNDASFVDLGTFNNGGGTQAQGAFGYKIVSTSTAITYAPTGTSGTYVGNLGAFIGTGGGASGSGQSQPLTGVTN